MQLPNKFSKDITIAPSLCDFSGNLGVYDTFRTFMDLANEHASILGVGQKMLMDKNLFWLTVKTRIRFYSRPKMDKTVTAQTWPVKPLSRKTDRCYRLLDQDKILAEGRTEWAILDTSTMTLSSTTSIFPEQLVFTDDSLSYSDFPRIAACDDTYTLKGSYTVNSSDIDMGMHMNNACYVRALLGLFTVQELQDIDIKEITLLYKASAHEGDVLDLFIKKNQNILEGGFYFKDSKPAILFQIVEA